VDRFTAAEFGFDDKVFYDEVEAKAGHYAAPNDAPNDEQEPKTLRIRTGNTTPYETAPRMLEVERERSMACVQNLLADPHTNKTLRRRVGSGQSSLEDPNLRFAKVEETKIGKEILSPKTANNHMKFVKVCIDAVSEGVKTGKNKEREVFSAAVVKDGEVVAVGVNQVIKKKDATATAEINAIRKAAKKLKTYNLQDCVIYSTVEPDVMSLGAILWSRIGKLYYGSTQKEAAQYGFEEGLLQYRELFIDPSLASRLHNVVTGFARDDCEGVFKAWQVLNGVVY
jgi:tRNA(Arg) A34 adenosine deaminase TadA